MLKLVAPVAVLAIVSFSTAALAGSGCGFGVKTVKSPQETVLQTPAPSTPPATQSDDKG